MKGINTTFNGMSPTRQPTHRGRTAFIGHRGAAFDAPENTLAAFELAWQQGVDGIEGDFHLTKDGNIVCIHDANTARTAGRSVKVAEATFAELRELDVGVWKGSKWRGARIPTLTEVLGTVPDGKRIYIEVKCGPEILPVLKTTLAMSRIRPSQIDLIAFDAGVLAAAKRLMPAVKTLWLTGLDADDRTGAFSPSVDDILATLETIGAEGVDCYAHGLVDRRFIEALRAAHKQFHVWTVDESEAAGRFLSMGVDAITSNRAGWLKQQAHRDA